MMRSTLLAAALVAAGLALLGFEAAFVGPSSSSHGAPLNPGVTGAGIRAVAMPESQPAATPSSSAWSSATSFIAGLCLGVALLVAGPGAAQAEVEDVTIPIDGKGQTATLSKEQLIRGRRLFGASCANCHIGGSTRTNQNVGLSLEELSGAVPNRASVNGLVDYLENPTTYDGLKEIYEVHPSIKGADVWPKMRSMKQQDLVDMSSYILYQNYTIPEKWGGGKQYY